MSSIANRVHRERESAIFADNVFQFTLDPDRKIGEDDTQMEYKDTMKQLETHYNRVKKLILNYQSATTGLYPEYGGEIVSNVGKIRDSIYCAMGCWALCQAYRRVDDDAGRLHELAQSAVKCMRGILICWMNQSNKLENFKVDQNLKNALHSQFDLNTGFENEQTSNYQHLQIDSVSLYLISLVQMIASGLQIIYTRDEVNFIQNLVFYVERAYRTPDFGMWERGTKYNNGTCELHASSIGMSKAALEIINGFNLYGRHGNYWSVIYVDIDAHNRNRTILETLLPRESNSKNTDCSLIPTLSFPCFALHDDDLVKKALDKVKDKLEGTYGWKRFKRDGYGTDLEKKNNKFYEKGETKEFEGIECEWPLFYIYMIIDGVFKKNASQVQTYITLLEPLLKQTEDDVIVPKYYYVPVALIAMERRYPGTQIRYSSPEYKEGSHFLWAQSLYLIANLLVEGHLHITEIDPVRKFLPSSERPRTSSRYSFFQGTASDLVVQIVPIAESSRLQSHLNMYGIKTQTPHQVEPIQIWPPSELLKAYSFLGSNSKLGLTGRPPRPIGCLGTSKFYRVCGTTIICHPLLLEVRDFYLSYDINLLLTDIKNEILLMGKGWKLSGRPTFCFLIRESNIKSQRFEILGLLAAMKKGEIDGIKVKLCRLQNCTSTSCMEHLDFVRATCDISYFKPFEELNLSGYQSFTERFPLESSIPKENVDKNLIKSLSGMSTIDLTKTYAKNTGLELRSYVLYELWKREGMQYVFDNETVGEMMDTVIHDAGSHKLWSVVRFCSAIRGKLADSLAPSLTSLLVRGKQLSIGVFGHEEETIDKPFMPNTLKEIIYKMTLPYDLYQAVLQQEMLLNVASIINTKPILFDGILTIRLGWLIHAINMEIQHETPKNTKPSKIHSMAPSIVKELLYEVLATNKLSDRCVLRTPIRRRMLEGALNRVPKDLYARVWGILEKAPKGITVHGHHLPQQPTLSEMTINELNFSYMIERLLCQDPNPAHRQIVVELLMVISTILKRNPELEFTEDLNVDELIRNAFTYFYKQIKGIDLPTALDDMTDFYNTPPDSKHGTIMFLAKAAINSLLHDQMNLEAESCLIN